MFINSKFKLIIKYSQFLLANLKEIECIELERSGSDEHCIQDLQLAPSCGRPIQDFFELGARPKHRRLLKLS